MRIIAFGNEVTVTRLTASLPGQEVELVARLRAVSRRFQSADELKNGSCAVAPKNFNKILAPVL